MPVAPPSEGAPNEPDKTPLLTIEPTLLSIYPRGSNFAERVNRGNDTGELANTRPVLGWRAVDVGQSGGQGRARRGKVGIMKTSVEVAGLPANESVGWRDVRVTGVPCTPGLTRSSPGIVSGTRRLRRAIRLIRCEGRKSGV